MVFDKGKQSRWAQEGHAVHKTTDVPGTEGSQMQMADLDFERQHRISTQPDRGERRPVPVDVNRLLASRACNVAGSEAATAAAANIAKLKGWGSVEAFKVDEDDDLDGGDDIAEGQTHRSRLMCIDEPSRYEQTSAGGDARSFSHRPSQPAALSDSGDRHRPGRATNSVVSDQAASNPAAVTLALAGFGDTPIIPGCPLDPAADRNGPGRKMRYVNKAPAPSAARGRSPARGGRGGSRAGSRGASGTRRTPHNLSSSTQLEVIEGRPRNRAPVPSNSSWAPQNLASNPVPDPAITKSMPEMKASVTQIVNDHAVQSIDNVTVTTAASNLGKPLSTTQHSITSYSPADLSSEEAILAKLALMWGNETSQKLVAVSSGDSNKRREKPAHMQTGSGAKDRIPTATPVPNPERKATINPFSTTPAATPRSTVDNEMLNLSEGLSKLQLSRSASSESSFATAVSTPRYSPPQNNPLESVDTYNASLQLPLEPSPIDAATKTSNAEASISNLTGSLANPNPATAAYFKGSPADHTDALKTPDSFWKKIEQFSHEPKGQRNPFVSHTPATNDSA